ncbi:RluA family pseudouridine synthase [Conexibacter sp. JD483]|uniref:RluA family pseudouridine synthase n=1 Tax=unclassified Conexibacter TaxID=2627773 RepID=UPI00271A1716|nr:MULTISPECIES: RluA family pseudouridine synthase [unclassified Conexibacter]MDO8189564.1 RluA family pseudouridine synthase [Conexibacter sp. CPCC 205706]MDO8201158.1 RluA family pseudouridine synthase [Conexibacter sp. CPCC 205762]MDR9372952.1 RluA family pseudouridine synthase [Conexibacter sp. JD483]
MAEPLRLEAAEGDAGERLDSFLATPLGSRAKAQRLIDAGLVTVDGAAQPKRHKLQVGERVEVAPEPQVELEPAGDAPYEIAYEDEHLLIVDKPAGVVVHPAPGHRTGTLSQALSGRAAGGEDPARAGIVHRLDRDTSGLLVVAKSEQSHRLLKAMIEAREVRREYYALVEGTPPARSGTIDAPIGRDRRVRTRMSTETDDPRDARTHFTLERALPDSALLRVVLETGRTHQIRVHLQAIGYPVVGDPEYGRAGRFGLQRQFLHATRLAFEHPLSGEQVDVSAPLPPDLAAVLARLESQLT